MKECSTLFFLSLVLSGCASAPPHWGDFYDSVPGIAMQISTPTSSRHPQVPEGTFAAKELLGHMKKDDARLAPIVKSFADVCVKRGGEVVETPTTGPYVKLSQALSAWNSYQPLHYGWATAQESWSIVCEDIKNRELQAAAIFSRPTTPGYYGATIMSLLSGKGVGALNDFYLRQEPERRAREISEALEVEELKKKREQQVLSTQRLQAAPRIGEETSIGLIVDLRPPLALIQYNGSYRRLRNLPPTEWVPISTLETPFPR